MLGGHRQIHDRQHHEYEGLDQNHKNVEYRPGESQNDLHEAPPHPANRGQAFEAARQCERREQQEDHLAGVQVAVQTQRQRYRAGEESHRLEDEVHRHQQRLQEDILRLEWLQRQLADETEDPLHLHAVEDDEYEDGERQREGGIDVGARHYLQVRESHTVCRPWQQVDRHQVHEVEQEHPAEDGERQRRNQAAAALEAVAHLRVDELDEDLDEVLQLARDSGGRPARHQPEQPEEHQREQHREEHGVVVDDVEVDDPVRLVVRQEGLVVQDVFGRTAGFLCRCHGYHRSPPIAQAPPRAPLIAGSALSSAIQYTR